MSTDNQQPEGEIPEEILEWIESQDRDYPGSGHAIGWKKGAISMYRKLMEPTETNVNDPETPDERNRRVLADWYRKQLREAQDQNKAILASNKEWGEKYDEVCKERDRIARAMAVAMDELYRYRARQDGFDDYCSAHGIPYDNECPECANIKL